MPDPTLPDLYLAWRQAKVALYYERRGVGMIELAKFEGDLPERLAALLPLVSDEAWFDDLPRGEVWVVPKRLDATQNEDDVVRLGVSRTPAPRVLDVQLRFTPSPQFAIAEVLYLRAFGPVLERLLSKNSIGYRLDLRDGVLDPYRRWIFEYWPKRYQEFRSAPLARAGRALADRDQSVVILSADLASFYDSIDPSFMLSESFVSALDEAGGPIDIDAYTRATSSLLGAMTDFRALASKRLGLSVATGIPIGSLTSRVVANAALATLDQHIESVESVLTYRRYVDDLVIVAKADSAVSYDKALAALLPLRPGASGDDVFHLDVDALDRSGSQFQLQRRKMRVHHLRGEPGQDFVEAVESDFDSLVSRNRAFLDDTALLQDGVTHLVRAGDGEGSPLRVLRDADRTRLERFALSTSLRTLERASVLVDVDEARELVRGTLQRVARIVNGEEDWVESLDAALRLLRLAVGTDDWESCKELNDRLEDVFGTVEALRKDLDQLRYRGTALPDGRARPWIWLRNYLHARRLEACASSVRLDVEPANVAAWLPDGLTVRTGSLKGVALRNRANRLARADVRSFDREDDSSCVIPLERPDDWMEGELGRSQEIKDRLALIREFVNECLDLEDTPWLMPPARLYLCTRPPSYFDIARRLLYRTESRGFDIDVFDRLLSVVNAIRGTRYHDPVGSVSNRHTAVIPWTSNDGDPSAAVASRDPRLVLGNLVVPYEHFTSATTGAPRLTIQRLDRLNRVLAKAEDVARMPNKAGLPLPTLLVLPELSIPRRWFRAVASHIVRYGGYGAVMGLEYLHMAAKKYVVNQAFAVIPGPFGSVATWPWRKRRPARGERATLQTFGVGYPPAKKPDPPRVVVKTSWGRFSTLICSELIEAPRIADLLGRAELIVCPAWNTDTASYDHLIQSAGFQLHAIIAIANNGHYSDCRAWAPRTERWRRDLCRLVERDVDDIVHVELPIQKLIEFHEGDGQGTDEWRPMPPNGPPQGAPSA